MYASVLTNEDESILNFYISDTPMRSPSRLAIKLPTIAMSESEFLYQMDRLYRCCLKPVSDLHQLHKNRITGMKIIDTVISRASPSYISVPHVIRMIWSIMSCIHHFQMRLRSGSTGLVHYSRKRTNKKCLKSYSKLIRLLEPQMHRIVLNAILIFYNEGKLWEFEFACTDLIVDLLAIYPNFEQVATDILNTVEAVALTNVSEARYLVQILYQVFGEVPSHDLSDGFNTRLLSMFESSISPKETDKFNYAPLRMSLQLCLRNLIKKMSNKGLLSLMIITLKKIKSSSDDNIIIDFGNIVIYAASKFRPKSFYRTITHELFDSIIDVTKMGLPIVVPIVERLWHNLLNRNDNVEIFSTPRVYLQDCDYKIKLRECIRTDKLFFKEHRHVIFQLVQVTLETSRTKYNLENIFQTIALSITEIPCGYNASTFVSAALAVQDYAFEITAENLVKSHHLHAIVMAIMSLVCYVHKAEVFYEYVNSIMERRAEWAPHLNPPLKVEYEYALHHVLWNKPGLFFEDWEARYGLWKCFRVKTKKAEK